MKHDNLRCVVNCSAPTAFNNDPRRAACANQVSQAWTEKYVQTEKKQKQANTNYEEQFCQEFTEHLPKR